MEDCVAIQQLINRYSVSSSRGDVDDIVSTYADNGVWKIPSMETAFEGHAAIRDGLTAFTSQQEYLVQQNAPGVIAVDGDSATATSTVCERGKVSGSEDAFEALGFYVDKIVRTPDGWRFQERSFELVTMRSVALTGH